MASPLGPRRSHAGLERELAALERRLRAELTAELDRRLSLLADHVDDELAQLTERVDTVHVRALRALTHRIGAQ